jgi:hypothetical protein
MLKVFFHIFNFFILTFEPLNNNVEIEHEMLGFEYRTRVLTVYLSISVHAIQLCLK